MNSPQFSSTIAPLAQGWRSLSGETLDALGRELTVSPVKLAPSKEPVVR